MWRRADDLDRRRRDVFAATPIDADANSLARNRERDPDALPSDPRNAVARSVDVVDVDDEIRRDRRVLRG
ncbi:MAG TPA: hypothetical protein VH436_20365 [Vicinamibacterales bacterium]